MPSTRYQIPSSVMRVREELAAARPREHFYAVLLGLDTYDAGGLHHRITSGLSWGALEKLRSALDLPLARIAAVLGVPDRTLARRREAGRLEPDESDRLLRLARVTGLALRLFEGDLPEARRWLEEPQRGLGGERPLDMARTEVGAREVEHLIGRLEHGIPS